jgi:hypothetical protein
MMEGSKVQIVQDKIHVSDVREILKQVEYFRKMQRIEKSRRDSMLWN